MTRVLTVVMAGGAGSRLSPLTLSQCKPALPIGGSYKLIDIPILNALASGCTQVFVLTQYLATSLHRHLSLTYSPEKVQVLAAEQKPGKQDWFRGTADAVRQSVPYLKDFEGDAVLILSGDHLYKHDFREMLKTLREKNADFVIASHPLAVEKATRMGVLLHDEKGRIHHFVEKPSLEELRKVVGDAPTVQVSTGIYLFKKDFLFHLLGHCDHSDFGKEAIPFLIRSARVFSHPFKGYWEDIGTVEAYYRANLDLALREPLFDLFDLAPMRRQSSVYLPPSYLGQTTLSQCLIGEGCRLEAQSIRHSIIGSETHVGDKTVIEESYLFGGGTKIGRHCHLKRVILDHQVTLGDHVKIDPSSFPHTYDADPVFIRDGIAIVRKGAHLPDGFTL